MNIDEFVKGKLEKIKKENFNRGYEDCKNGLKPQMTSESYLNGYGCRYEEEQQLSRGVN